MTDFKITRQQNEYIVWHYTDKYRISGKFLSLKEALDYVEGLREEGEEIIFSKE